MTEAEFTLTQALHRISLCSQNSMSSIHECGKIAREAIQKANEQMEAKSRNQMVKLTGNQLLDAIEYLNPYDVPEVLNESVLIIQSDQVLDDDSGETLPFGTFIAVEEYASDGLSSLPGVPDKPRIKQVKFGTGNRGLGVATFGKGTVVSLLISKPHPFGEVGTDLSGKKIYLRDGDVELAFSNPESMQVVIDVLTNAKNEFTKPV